MQRRSLFQALFATGVGVFALPAMAKDHKEWPPSAGHGHGHGKGKPPKFDKDDRDHPRYHNARGHAFGRGRPLPGEFRGPHYIVTDYRRYRLPRPGRYQHWVQVGPDFVLVVAATGLIVNVVIGN